MALGPVLASAFRGEGTDDDRLDTEQPRRSPTRATSGLPVAIGADVTLYHIPTDLEFSYDPSHSLHVFVHWRPRTAHAPTHVH